MIIAVDVGMWDMGDWGRVQVWSDRRKLENSENRKLEIGQCDTG